jgi:hypothetical protein
MERPLLIVASYASAALDALDSFFGLFMGQIALTHEIKRIGFRSGPELMQAIDEIPPARLRRTIALIHLSPGGDPFNVNHFTDREGLGTALVLSYPEIHFLFLDVAARWTEEPYAPPAIRSHCAHFHALPKILASIQYHAEGSLPIFDPTALRAQLLNKMNEIDRDDHSSMFAPFTESRISHAAFVADEETSWAFMNGYLAYKAGYRARLITTKAEFVRSLLHVDPHQCQLILSDLDLSFPDDNRRSGESRPSGEREAFLLETIVWPKDGSGGDKPLPTFLITGYLNMVDKRLCDCLWPGLQHPERQCCRTKPYSGFYSLLAEERPEAMEPLAKSFGLRNGDTFGRWKSCAMRDPRKTPGGFRHTAPYKRLTIAERLLNRARILGAGDCRDPKDFIQAALLAGEAKELLGGTSRTTYFEAIALQNEYETQAELSFFGSVATLDARYRVERISRELALAKRPSPPGARALDDLPEANHASLNCSLQIVGSLRNRYSRAEQMEGAEECLRQLASGEADLAVLRLKSRAGHRARFWDKVRSLFRLWGIKYVDWVTNAGTSLSRLAAINVGWVFIFGLFYVMVLRMVVPEPEDLHLGHVVGKAFAHSFFTFIQVAPGPPTFDRILDESSLHGEPVWKLACYWLYISGVYLEMVLAYLHLGLLVAILYRRLTRHAP